MKGEALSLGQSFPLSLGAIYCPQLLQNVHQTMEQGMPSTIVQKQLLELFKRQSFPLAMLAKN